MRRVVLVVGFLLAETVLSLVYVEARALMPQGWLFLGVLRHTFSNVIAWRLLPEWLLVQAALFSATILAGYWRPKK